MNSANLRTLARCAVRLSLDLDVARSRQILADVHQRHPNFDEAALFVESAKRLGMRIQALDDSPTAPHRLARPSRPILANFSIDQESPSRWAILDAGGGEILDDQPPSGRLSRRELRRILRRSTAPIRWFVVDPLLPSHGAVTDHAGPSHVHGPRAHHHLSPTRRLLALIRPDVSDIRIVTAYAAGVGILSLATPLAIEALVTTVALNQLVQQLVILSLVLLVCLLLAAALRALQTYLVELLQRRLFTRVASDFADRLPRVCLDAFDDQYGPELVNRFFDVLTVQKVGASLLLDGISVVLSAVLGLAVLAFYHPYLLGFDLILLLVMALMLFGLGRGAIRTSIDESIAKYAVAAQLEEIARAPLAYKATGAADFAFDRIDGLTGRYLESRRRHFSILMRQVVFGLGAQAVATAALLGLGGYLVIQEQLNLGQLVAAELIVATVLAGFAKLGKHLESWYDLMAATDKLGHLIDLPLERGDGHGLPAPPRRPSSLRIRGLHYGHDSHHPSLRGLDLDLRPGERVLITGPPGSGKSTLADLLFAVRTPSSGSIRLDGVNIRDLSLDSLRERVAVVKRLDLLSETIYDNVALGRLDLHIGQVRDALRDVGLADDVDHFPDGLATRLNTGGAPLSLGQARRLLLARAIVGRPSLLVLDGTLDGHHPDVRSILIETVFAPSAPWTLLITSYDDEVARRCDRAVDLSPNAAPLRHDHNNGHAPVHGDGEPERAAWPPR